jgi:hypothetical protein
MSVANDNSPSSPFVVQYDEIPAVSPEAPTSAKFRPFLGERLLGTTVPGRGVGLELVQVPAGVSAARRTSSRSLIIVLQGGAELVAGSRHTMQAGDSVTVPESFSYGVTAGAKGFEALVVSFASRPGEARRQVLTLEQLLARNQERTQTSLQRPFFRKLTRHALRDPADRRRFYDGLRVFSEAVQTLLLARQATCAEGDHAALFLGQLRKELGAQDVSTGVEAAPAFDPVLQATTTWFCNQMFVLDDLDKTVVNLVLGTASNHLHQLSELVFGGDVREKHLASHGLDREHEKLGLHLLENQPPQVYQRLAAVLERSWDMFEALTGRIFELVAKRTEGLANGS